MARFCGIIGFGETRPGARGVNGEVIIERTYRGDVIRDSLGIATSSSQVNPELNIGNRFSIVMDPYARIHYSSIRYVVWMNTPWKVTSVEIQRPRLILSVSGVYAKQTDPEDDKYEPGYNDDYG